MITHSINVYTTRGNARKIDTPTRDGIGSEYHKRFILNKALKHNHFEEGDWVFYKRKKGQITHIYDTFEDVEWDSLKARFIEVWVNNELIVCHPSDLRRAK